MVDLRSKAYFELENQFRLFIVKNYSNALDKYMDREATHADKEVMREVLLSTISITLNVNDINGHRLTANDYLLSLRDMIVKFDVLG